MLCRACGRTSSCSKYLQREAAGKVPGEPPKRVRVIHNDMTFDRQREERIEWKYGLWGVLFGAFWTCLGAMVLWKDIRVYAFEKSAPLHPERLA